MMLSALVAALALSAVHLVAARLRFLDGTPRSRWLSAAGGVSVAYVFVHLLPELAAAQDVADQMSGGAMGWLDREVYLVALLGLVVFYGLDRLVKRSEHLGSGAGERTAGSGAFWVHLGSFAVYNLIIGCLLVHREQPGALGLALFATAMALHFLVTDYGLRADYRVAWVRVGRWVLIGAVLVGWAVGAAVEVSEVALGGITALLGGGVILNVLKEELPEERQGRLGPFFLGAGGYAVLLLFV